jgi:thioredoxin reductase (NADPH)
VYDIVIIGAGPAGMTAAIYSARARMKTMLIAEAIPGGQVMLTEEIENYPGFESVSGIELMNKMYEQTKKLEIDIKPGMVKTITKKDKGFVLGTDSGDIETSSVILATGASYKKLGAKGEAEFTGRGVSYCGVCDAPFFRNKEIAVIGGGDTAVYEAGHLLKFASRIHIIHRKDRLRATKIMQDKVLGDPKTVPHWDSVVEEIYGSNTVDGIKIKNLKTGESSQVTCKGAFIFVGVQPHSELVKGLADISESGYVISDDDMRTSVPGIFACGDVRKKTLRQISTAVGEAATAAFSAQHYVEELKGIAYK